MALSRQRRRGVRLVAAGAVSLLALAVGVAHAQPQPSTTEHTVAGEDSGELMDSFNSFDDQRLSPTASAMLTLKPPSSASSMLLWTMPWWSGRRPVTSV